MSQKGTYDHPMECTEGVFFFVDVLIIGTRYLSKVL